MKDYEEVCMASTAVRVKTEIVDESYTSNETTNSDDMTPTKADSSPGVPPECATSKSSGSDESLQPALPKRRRVEKESPVRVNGHKCEKRGVNFSLGPPHDHYEPEHSCGLLKQLDERRTGEQFIDLVLVVQGKEIPCHKVVLCSMSSYFSELLVPNSATKYQQRLYVNETSMNIMNQLVEFAYTSKITISEANIEPLLTASNLFKFTDVYKACIGFLKYRVSLENCFHLKRFAEKQSCEDLADWMLSFIHHYFQHLSSTSDFLELSPEELIILISSNELNVKQEKVIYLSVMKWVKHDLPKRKKILPQLLEHVRLPLVKPQFLLDVVEPEPLIKNNQDCEKYLNEAKRYQLLPEQRPLLQSPRTRPRSSYASKKTEILVTVGGLNKEKVPVQDCCYIDFPDPTPKHVAPIQVSQSAYSVAVVNNNIFLSGGAKDKPMAEVWMYIPSLDKWKQVAPMREARYLHASVGLDGFLFVIGGLNSEGRLKSVEQYNPDTNTWCSFKPMLKALSSPCAVACDGQLFVIGGATGSGPNDISSDVQRYIPDSDIWQKVASLPQPERGAVAANLDGLIYVMGKGKSVIAYNKKTDKWTKLNNTNGGHLHGAATVHKGHLYIAGGLHGNAYVNGTVEMYDRVNDAWHVTATLHAPVYAQGFVSIFKDPTHSSN